MGLSPADRVPAEHRYLLLKTWTLPKDSRHSVRLLAVLVPHDGPPPEFNAVPSRDVARQGVLSSADLLIDAAREAGKLDELADDLLDLSDLGVENAETLHMLVEIACGHGPEVREQITHHRAGLPAKLTQSRQESPRNYQGIAWEDYLLARACTTNPVLRGLGENILRLLATFPHNWSNLNDAMITYAIRDFDDSASARGSGVAEPRNRDPGLVLWHPASHLDSAVHRLGWVRPRWVVEGDTLRHVVGPEYDFLYFNYPLAGSFELSFDTYNSPQFFGSGAWGCVSYNGYVAEPRTLGIGANTWAVGIQDRAYTVGNNELRADTYRLRAQVEPGKIRFLINDVLFFEETTTSGISPWLALNTWRVQNAAFWNLQLTGEPEIPREVRLIRDHRLEGWISSFYLETQPWRIGNGRRRQDLNIMPAAEPEHADWYARDGVIFGRHRTERADPNTVMGRNSFEPEAVRDLERIWDDKTFPVQSRLYYHRPLRDGDTLGYEFLYEPGKTEVHPSLGRLTFLSHPEGVRLHWITDIPFDDPTGLHHDNVIDVPNDRRGSEQLPLKPGEWNQMTISLTGDTAVLTLNGVDVYERALQKTNGRFFGLFHWKDRTAVEVRNVVLKGDWPEKLTPEMLANLLARSGEVAPADQ